MDLSGLRVKVSGPLLGKILHERHKFDGSCIGMVYGEVISETKSEITDSDHVTKTSAHIVLRDYFPVSRKAFLDMQSSKHTAWEEKSYLPLSSCVGIFSIRTTGNSLTLLEKSMHRRLAKDIVTSNCKKTNPSIVVSLLINFYSNDDATCLNWVISAFVLQNSEFKRIKIEVCNLQGSLSGSYLTNSAPVSNTDSSSASGLLESFQTAVTDSGGRINIVEATRNTTKKLISELDKAFEKLQENEKKLDTALSEKERLLNEWNSLIAKKNSKKTKSLASSQEVENNKTAINSNLHRKNDGTQSLNHCVTEKEYQAVKRRSLEDIRRRSPVVVLEKLENEGAVGNSSCALPKKFNSDKKSVGDLLATNADEDHFSHLVSSAKKELEKDEVKKDIEDSFEPAI